MALALQERAESPVLIRFFFGQLAYLNKIETIQAENADSSAQMQGVFFVVEWG